MGEHLHFPAAPFTAGAPLIKIVEQEIAPFAHTHGAPNLQRLTVEGPDIRVTARAAQTLTVAIHEPATNAAKYGAFSTDGGSVAIRWHIEPEREVLVFEWNEHGAPVADPKTHRTRFGKLLIDTTIQQQLGGELQRTWSGDGLKLKASMPLARLQRPVG